MKAEMFNVSGWDVHVMDDDVNVDKLVRQLESKLIRSGFTVLNYCEHKFSPHGFTALWLLGESHFAIHTFPEEETYYWELSSCVKEYYDNFIVEMS